jgi:hypothetical protein
VISRNSIKLESRSEEIDQLNNLERGDRLWLPMMLQTVRHRARRTADVNVGDNPFHPVVAGAVKEIAERDSAHTFASKVDRETPERAAKHTNHWIQLPPAVLQICARHREVGSIQSERRSKQHFILVVPKLMLAALGRGHNEACGRWWSTGWSAGWHGRVRNRSLRHGRGTNQANCHQDEQAGVQYIRTQAMEQDAGSHKVPAEVRGAALTEAQSRGHAGEIRIAASYLESATCV